MHIRESIPLMINSIDNLQLIRCVKDARGVEPNPANTEQIIHGILFVINHLP